MVGLRLFIRGLSLLGDGQKGGGCEDKGDGRCKSTQMMLMAGVVMEDVPSMYLRTQHWKALVTYSE